MVVFMEICNIGKVKFDWQVKLSCIYYINWWLGLHRASYTILD